MEYIPAKTIVTRTKRPSEWFGIDYNMNIYKGCCHGCIYCDSRSSCYGVDNFDQVRAKKDALRIIRDDLRRKVKTGVVGTGAMSDPYNPFEKELELTRHALELCDAFAFGTAIATKSCLLLRDIDILKSIAEHSPVLCKVTVTTADDALGKRIEPGVVAPSERFHMIARLAEEKIFAGVLFMPVLPFIEDSAENVDAIIKQAAECGARFIYPAFGMTLRGNQREWYFRKLNQLFPGEGLVEKYILQFGESYNCVSPKADILWKRLVSACDAQGILYRMQDIIHAYKAPYRDKQMSIFDFIQT